MTETEWFLKGNVFQLVDFLFINSNFVKHSDCTFGLSFKPVFKDFISHAFFFQQKQLNIHNNIFRCMLEHELF